MNKKLNLDLDALSVDSFETDAAADSTGTVHGRTDDIGSIEELCADSFQLTCGLSCGGTCESCSNTCNATCGDTCGDPCGQESFDNLCYHTDGCTHGLDLC